ncbi:hypothetical protein ABIE67_003918 [Streptomyces sp. V4I8]
MRLRRVVATSPHNPAAANEPHTPAFFCASSTNRTASDTCSSLSRTTAKSCAATVIWSAAANIPASGITRGSTPGASTAWAHEANRLASASASAAALRCKRDCGAALNRSAK